MTQICEQCKQSFEASRARFCSKACREQSLRIYEAECTTCGKITLLKKFDFERRQTTLCKSCLGSVRNNPSGSAHSHWQGGHKYWSKGRFGKDPQDLSWSRQKRLCWERDNYTCQHCGKSRQTEGPDWNPDAHHITPWTYCHSHDLNNLVGLCDSCHKIADLKWHRDNPDAIPLDPIKITRKPAANKCHCEGCGRKVLQSPCRNCVKLTRVLLAKEFVDRGASQQEVADHFKVSQSAVSQWLTTPIHPGILGLL